TRKTGTLTARITSISLIRRSTDGTSANNSSPRIAAADLKRSIVTTRAASISESFPRDLLLVVEYHALHPTEPPLLASPLWPIRRGNVARVTEAADRRRSRAPSDRGEELRRSRRTRDASARRSAAPAALRGRGFARACPRGRSAGPTARTAWQDGRHRRSPTR